MDERVDPKAGEVDRRADGHERRKGWVSFRIITLAKIAGGFVLAFIAFFSPIIEKYASVIRDYLNSLDCK